MLQFRQHTTSQTQADCSNADRRVCQNAVEILWFRSTSKRRSAETPATGDKHAPQLIRSLSCGLFAPVTFGKWASGCESWRGLRAFDTSLPGKVWLKMKSFVIVNRT